MNRMTTIIDSIVAMQEAVLVLCMNEDGEEKKAKLNECATKI